MSQITVGHYLHVYLADNCASSTKNASIMCEAVLLPCCLTQMVAVLLVSMM